MEEFEVRFPRINRIPVFRSILRWFYKEGWIYSIGLLLLVVLSVFLLSFRLGVQDLYEDEYSTVGAAAGYYHTGTFYEWDWLKQTTAGTDTNCVADNPGCDYTRAWVDSWLIAQSFKLFGVSAWSARFVSVILGILSIPIFYFVAKFFSESKKVALLATAAFVINPAFIEIFRYARMYALLIPCFLFFSYFSYRAITEETLFTTRHSILNEAKKFLNFNYSFLILASLLLILNYLIHINSLILLPSIIFFCIYLATIYRENKYFVILLLGILGILVSAWASYAGYFHSVFQFISWFKESNYDYYDFLISFPLPLYIGSMLLAFGVIFIYFLSPRLRDKISYLYFILITTLTFFIWIGARYASSHYVSHVVPLTILLITFSYCFLLDRMPRSVRFMGYLIFLIAAALGLLQSVQIIYTPANGEGRFSVAYQSIIQNFNPNSDVIFGSFSTTYYLQKLPDPKKVQVINFGTTLPYTYSQFLSDIHTHKSGWITWQTNKGFHIQGPILAYIEGHFKEYSGTGINNTNVEVYYYDQSMVN